MNVPARVYVRDVEKLVNEGLRLNEAVAKVARKEGVRRSTLQRVANKAGLAEEHPRTRALSDEQETALYMVAISLSRLDLPLSYRCLRKLVYEVWDVRVGDLWVKGFLHRHKVRLSCRTPTTFEGKML